MLASSMVDPVASRDTPGDWLYRALVAPAGIAAGSSVVIVPDGALYGINFETLPVDGPPRHYLIEDATIQVAPALSMLTAGARRAAPKRPAGPAIARAAMTDAPGLLLIGNPVARAPEFPALQYASTEMSGIVRYFPPGAVAQYDEGRATPAAYRDERLDRFSMIHFTAHAIANMESPLESAVVLSGPDGAYKLYARDVADRPLDADLVTVSACRSAGERTYSGEGLVGFAWAFLRAGARRVIAGLWDVDDRSTARLMDALYAGLAAGHPPAQSLRDAKLALMHESAQLSRPYYWGPFQLFTVVPS
jgi:CHAT domain-containing protein